MSLRKIRFAPTVVLAAFALAACGPLPAADTTDFAGKGSRSPAGGYSQDADTTPKDVTVSDKKSEKSRAEYNRAMLTWATYTRAPSKQPGGKPPAPLLHPALAELSKETMAQLRQDAKLQQLIDATLDEAIATGHRFDDMPIDPASDLGHLYVATTLRIAEIVGLKSDDLETRMRLAMMVNFNQLTMHKFEPPPISQLSFLTRTMIEVEILDAEAVGAKIIEYGRTAVSAVTRPIAHISQWLPKPRDSQPIDQSGNPYQPPGLN